MRAFRVILGLAFVACGAWQGMVAARIWSAIDLPALKAAPNAHEHHTLIVSGFQFSGWGMYLACGALALGAPLMIVAGVCFLLRKPATGNRR